MLSLQDVYHILFQHFGPQGWWPLYNDSTGKIEYHADDYSLPKNEEQAFEIGVGAILTQNTTWKNVENVLVNLRQHDLLNREALAKIPEEELAVLIRSAGYFRQKAKKLKAFVAFNGPFTRENLLAIWGIGKETADSILCYAHHQPVFVVDAYTQRIFHRLGFSEQVYDDIQQRVMNEIYDAASLNNFHALLVELGKNVCTKQQPHCHRCPLLARCMKRGL